uniref:Proliferation-inducing protein 25 n=1 Tax=Homo sapiens TaxID=9606 RepID=B6RHJ8_HUMAN|nr:proliferation-inducing protein 25 [Homo sapiens]
MPPHSSLGNRVRLCLEKKKKEKKIPQIISCRDFTNQAYFADNFPGIMVEGITAQIHSSHKNSQQH